MAKILSLFFLLSVFACGHENSIPVSSGKDYYPLQAGCFVDLQVSKTTYSISESAQNTEYFFRQIIDEPISGSSGEMIFPLRYLSRNTDEDLWKLDSISSARALNDKLLLVENGRTIVNLSFPLTERNFWDANAYNLSGERFFELRNLGKPMQIGQHFFPKTVTLIRQNDSTRISQKKHIEVYAENVGLIKREIAFLTFCYGANCKGTTEISSGWTESSIIKNYGK